MCPPMTTGFQNQEKLPEKHFSKHLAATVRNIQWSYAIFWSFSTRQPGVLAWSDGYYNGDIKTRKTTEAMEFKDDQMGLQRSDQLRELYWSLSAGESNPQARRPSASLSPEDLTEMEWYYLVCMSFTFSSGQGLPGRALASTQHIWLNNAPFADSKTFSRNLLAKSASVQTVVCFPFMDGVLEMGTTEQVLDDPALIQHVITSFLTLSNPAFSENSISSSLVPEKDEEDMCTPIFPLALPSHASHEEAELVWDKIEGLHDDEFINDFHGSKNPSNLISQPFLNPERVLPSPKGERVKSNLLDYLQEGNYTELVSLDLVDDKSHYTRTLSLILRNTKQLASIQTPRRSYNESSFSLWKRNSSSLRPNTSTPQKLLKQILMDAGSMHSGQTIKPHESNKLGDNVSKSEVDDVGMSHVLSERRRREKLNEKFNVLRSLVPTISKADKSSILGDTIEYLKELERRVEELESCTEAADLDATGRQKHQDIADKTSENYGSKRKACEIEETESEGNWVLMKDGPIDVNVTMTHGEVLVEMHCPWRDCLLLEIIEAISNLHLDTHLVQSSTADGILELTLRAKFRGSVVASLGMIKRALHRVVSKSRGYF